MNRNNIIIGDFNSHNHLWGYRDDDENGLFLEEWISTNNLHLTHDSRLPNTFNSGRWKRGYNPDLTHNSKKGWQTLSRINGIDRKPIISPNVTPDAIAHQLLLNGKPDQNCKIRNKKAVLKTDSHETMLTPFTIRYLGDAISLLKNGKAPGLDNIHHEMIKCFGPTTRLWLPDMLNDCLKQQQIPNAWRKAKLVAMLKPGKDPESPKSYRPIALLCSLYKLLERMILTRFQCKIEHRLIPQQAGFRPGKSCCSQVLNLTQHIEDGFELGQITGAAFIDLTAAYDTINHRRLLVKLLMLTDDVPLTKFIRTMLSNRRLIGRTKWQTE